MTAQLALAASQSAPSLHHQDDPDPRVVRCFEQHALETARPAADDGEPGSDDAAHQPPPSSSTSAAAALVQAEIEAREAELVHRLLASQDKLPRGTPTTTTSVLDVARSAAALSRSAGLGSSFRALQALKRAPELLSLPERELAMRALALKVALPAADVGALVSLRPSLLLMGGDAAALRRAVSSAARQVSALMPGIPWQGKLAEAGTVYWSFMSVLDEGLLGGARAAADLGEAEGEQQRGRPP